MTQKTKDLLRRAAYWAALLVPALGGAWSAVSWADSRKLDVGRFVTDSTLTATHDSTKWNGVADALRDLKSSVDSANLRLRQIQCGKTVEMGCR